MKIYGYHTMDFDGVRHILVNPNSPKIPDPHRPTVAIPNPFYKRPRLCPICGKFEFDDNETMCLDCYIEQNKRENIERERQYNRFVAEQERLKTYKENYEFV